MFITCEGIEGSGKSTAMRALGAWLEGTGREVVYTREPGGSPLGVALRAILLDARNSEISPRAELFLYLADRAQHVEQVIKPALERGAFVLSDRYADSTVVYQGYGRGLPPDGLYSLNSIAAGGLWPDLTLLFDIDPQKGLARAAERNRAEGKTVTEGRFEAESLAFHQRIREGFLDWAAKRPERFRVIDGSGVPDAVFSAARAAVETMLQTRGLS